MNLDELLCQHRIAEQGLAEAQSGEDRQTYADLVRYYAERIRRMRHQAGDARHRFPLAPTVPERPSARRSPHDD